MKKFVIAVECDGEIKFHFVEAIDEVSAAHSVFPETIEELTIEDIEQYFFDGDQVFGISEIKCCCGH